jgi:hypothetical protein
VNNVYSKMKSVEKFNKGDESLFGSFSTYDQKELSNDLKEAI